MVKATINHGQIQLLEPLPAAWRDGQSLVIDSESDVNESFDPDSDHWTVEQIDAHFAELNEMCSHNDPADDEARQKAINQHRHEQKELMRKQMGLS